MSREGVKSTSPTFSFLQVGQISILSLHLSQMTWPLRQEDTGGRRGMLKHTGHSTDSWRLSSKLMY